MQLRHALESDLSQILALEQENFPAAEQIASTVIESYIRQHGETCLVLAEEELLAYILALPSAQGQVTDNLYEEEAKRDKGAPYLLVASLSIALQHRHQGLGSLLLAALKEVAHHKGYQGIGLTCHEELISYYQMNGFVLQGISDSRLAGQIWYDLYWESP